MRIISGQYGGRRFYPPTGLPVRPTTDQAREGLFNILNNMVDYESIAVLDLFSGTGCISLEFASRGCTDITAIDQNYRCTAFLQKCSAELNTLAIRVVRADAFHIMGKAIRRWDVIFADPPYELQGIDAIPGMIFKNNLLNDSGMLILEHSPKYSFRDAEYFVQTRNYGKVHFTFFLKPY